MLQLEYYEIKKRKVSARSLLASRNSFRYVTPDEFGAIRTYIYEHKEALGIPDNRYTIVTNGYGQVKQVIRPDGTDVIDRLNDLIINNVK